MKSEATRWAIALAVLLAAWAAVCAVGRYQIGPMDNPDDFSPFPPVSLLIAATILGPATAVFLVLAVGRGVHLLWRAARSSRAR